MIKMVYLAVVMLLPGVIVALPWFYPLKRL